VNCSCEFCLEALVISASVCWTRLTPHGVSDADVETAWAFLESEPTSTNGDFEPTEFLMRNHLDPLSTQRLEKYISYPQTFFVL